MNPIRLTGRLAAVLMLVLASGCAFMSPSRAPSSPQAAQVGVYEASPPGDKPYKFVRRLWVEPWSSAFSLPQYESVAAGADDLRNQAVALGGDAVVNFGCYHSSERPQSRYYCNGTVIRYVN